MGRRRDDQIDIGVLNIPVAAYHSLRKRHFIA